MPKKEKILFFLDRAITFFIYLLCFFLPISIAFIEIFSTIIIFLFFIKKIIKPDFKFLKDKSSIFLIIFVMFCILSLFNSGIYFKKSIGALFFKWFEYIIIFLAIKDVIEPKKIKKIIFIILLSATLIGIDGLFQHFFGFDFIRHRKSVEIPPTGSKDVITATFKHYNDFGAYLVVVLSLAFIYSFKDKKYFIKFLFLTIILFFCLLFTYSRGAWLGFLLSILFASFFLKRRFFIFLVLLFLVFFIFNPMLKERFYFTFSNTGDSGRFSLWKTAFLMIKDNPFLGKGIGTFMDYSHIYNKELGYQYAHNSYIQIAAETGIFSLLFFILFIFSIIYTNIKIFIKNKDVLILSISSAIFGYCVHSFFDTQFYGLQTAMLFWIILGLGSKIKEGFDVDL